MFNTQYVAQQTVTDYGLPFSKLKFSATLTASTDTTLTIPDVSGNYKAVIRASTPVWVALNAPAHIPSGATFVQTESELTLLYITLCRQVKSGDVLHFFSSSPASVSVVLYSIDTV